MKKTAKCLLMLMLLAVMLTSFSACTLISGLFNSLTEGAVESIAFEDDSVTIELNTSSTLAITVTPEDSASSVNYSSSDESIVTVSNDGKVKGVGIGEATVTAEAGGGEISDTVTVKVVYAPVRTLEIDADGTLNQTNTSGQRPQKITFTANPNGLNNAAPGTAYSWVIRNKETNETAKTQSGKSVEFTMEQISGVTYVVTVTSGEVSASVECGYYEPMHDVTLDYAEDGATAVLGEEITLSLLWPASSNQNPEIKWYVKKGTAAAVQIKNETEATLTVTPVERVLHQYYAKVDGVESTKVEFTPAYGEIKSVTVTPNTEKVKIGKEAVFLLEYDLSFVDPDSDVTLEIYANGRDAAKTNTVTKTASVFNVAEVKVTYPTIGVKAFAVKLNGVWGEATVTAEETIYAPMRINPIVSGSLLQANGAYSEVAFTSNVYPVTAVQTVEWYVNDVKRATGTTFAYTPSAAGEYHVKAVAGNVESAYTTIVCYSSSSPFAEYAENYHSYGGNQQNRYITNQREFNNIIQLAIETELTSLSVYVDYSSGVSLKDKIEKATGDYAESGVRPQISYPVTNTGKVALTLNYATASTNNPTRETGGTAVPQDTTVPPHYASGSGIRTLYIENPELPGMNVYSSNMLYKAVQWGYRPNFVGDNAVRVRVSNIYSNAKNVLKRIITDDMTDLEKVHAIYDWICFNVAYDFELRDMTDVELKDSMEYYGYYLEGVFLDSADRRAVCDGKSKAFVLLCGMEGITAIRVSGEAGVNPANRGGHAWNKVLLDADDNGYAEWYFVDTTWGDSEMSGKEFTTHSYFLTSDEANAATHVEKEGSYPAAEGSSYDAYADIAFVIDPTSATFNGYIGLRYEGDLYIDNQEELNKLFTYAKYMGYGKVEFKLAFTTNFDNAASTARSTSGYSASTYYPLGNDVYVMLKAA